MQQDSIGNLYVVVPVYHRGVIVRHARVPVVDGRIDEAALRLAQSIKRLPAGIPADVVNI